MLFLVHSTYCSSSPYLSSWLPTEVLRDSCILSSISSSCKVPNLSPHLSLCRAFLPFSSNFAALLLVADLCLGVSRSLNVCLLSTVDSAEVPLCVSASRSESKADDGLNGFTLALTLLSFRCRVPNTSSSVRQDKILCLNCSFCASSSSVNTLLCSFFWNLPCLPPRFLFVSALLSSYSDVPLLLVEVVSFLWGGNDRRVSVKGAYGEHGLHWCQTYLGFTCLQTAHKEKPTCLLILEENIVWQYRFDSRINRVSCFLSWSTSLLSHTSESGCLNRVSNITRHENYGAWQVFVAAAPCCFWCLG